MHIMAQSQELEAASRSSETYLAENGGGRPASVQPRSCIRAQEGTGQNYLARTHGNGYVTDKPRMMMMHRCRVAGVSCDRCAENYYGDPLVPGGSCDRCACNQNIDHGVPGSCDPRTGECLKCLYHTEGFRCERCRPGYFGDAAAQNCRGQSVRPLLWTNGHSILAWTTEGPWFESWFGYMYSE